MQSPAESLCWQLASSSKHWKLLKGHVRSITGSLLGLTTEMFLFLPLPSIQIRDNKPTSHSFYERLIWSTTFSWQVRTHCCWGNRAEWEPDCKRDAEDSMGLRCICPVPWERDREQASKVGGDRWDTLEILVLRFHFQPATNSQHGELCSPSCKVNTCERTTGVCLQYIAKYSRLQRIKIPSGKTHGLK